MSNFVVSIAPGSASISNGQITYTYVLTMDAAASVDEPISYELKGVGANPASSDELSTNQSLTGTVVFKPGETQKTLTVTLPTNPASGPDKTFEVQLTSSLAWVTPNPDKDSVIALVSSTPKSGYGKVIDGDVYYPQSKVFTYTPTRSNDYVEISGGSTIKTLAGNDKVIATSGNNIIDAGDGNDVITLGSGNDNVTAGKGDDVIYVTQLNTITSKVDGGAGIDTLDLSKVTDAAGVTVDLNQGHWSIDLWSPTSPITGVEIVIGSSGSDTLYGGKGREIINGGAGHDVIISGYGNDDVEGGEGDDEIDGGQGMDEYTGGSGLDAFVFMSLRDINKVGVKTDVITDFTHGEDLIYLLFDLDTKTEGDQSLFKRSYDWNLFIGDQFFSKKPGQIRYTPVYSSDSQNYIFLQGDTNGDGNADWMIKLIGVTSLSTSDFLGGPRS